LGEFRGDMMKENPYNVIGEMVNKEFLSFYEGLKSQMDIPVDNLDSEELISLMKLQISKIDLSKDDISKEIFDHKEFCKKMNITEKDFMIIYSKLSPFYKKAENNNHIEFGIKIMFDRARFKIIKRDIFITVSNTYNILNPIKDNFNKKQKSLLNLNLYFFMVEGIYVAYIDLILLILILGGYNYSGKPNKKNIEAISYIKSLYLADKINFLNEVGLDVISNGYHRDLRNAIGHSDFIIDKEGDIFIEKQTNKIDILNEFNKLKLLIHAIEGAIQKCSVDIFIDWIAKGKKILKEMDEFEEKYCKNAEK
jgi:hypothetical protein